MNIKNIGYNFRTGYTLGFNDGLTDKINKHELPESEWMPADKIDLEYIRRHQEEFKFLLSPETYGEKNEYHKIGYNWGHMQGREAREALKNEMPGQDFEKSLGEFANCLRIIYLQINKEYYLHGVAALEPEKEKEWRLSFIYLFVKKTGEILPGKEIPREIKTLLSESKLLQAIDKAIPYFKELKNLNDYTAALTLKSKLMDLRGESKKQKIEKADYLAEKRRLGNSLSELIDKYD
jgi:hypothetical protein